jgi:hypothetical protein
MTALTAVGGKDEHEKDGGCVEHPARADTTKIIISVFILSAQRQRLCLAATVHQLSTVSQPARQQPFVGQDSQSILGTIPQMKVMITTIIPRYDIVLFERRRQMEHAIVITVAPNQVNGSHSAKTMGSYQTPLIHHTAISALYVSTKAFMAVVRRSLNAGKIFIVFCYLLLSLCPMFNVPRLPFAGNLANDGSILVLYDELFKVKMRQGDQLVNRGVAFSGFSVLRPNALYLETAAVEKKRPRCEGRSTARSWSFNILESYIMGTGRRASEI